MDEKRPYPEGFAWDEAWRQRQRADRLEAAMQEVLSVVICSIAPLMPVDQLEAVSKQLRSSS